jgi:amino acid efflux transporter
MSGLKQELGLAQGVGLLSTSLLGTGVFAVPALAALVAGNNSLWAWPVLIVLVFPVAIVFAVLGRHFPAQAAWRTLSAWRLARDWSASPAGCFFR